MKPTTQQPLKSKWTGSDLLINKLAHQGLLLIPQAGP